MVVRTLQAAEDVEVLEVMVQVEGEQVGKRTQDELYLALGKWVDFQCRDCFEQ